MIRPRRYSARLRDWPQRAGGHERGDYRWGGHWRKQHCRRFGLCQSQRRDARQPSDYRQPGKSDSHPERTGAGVEKTRVPVNTRRWWNAAKRTLHPGWSHYGKSKQGVSGWRLMKTCGQKPQPEVKLWQRNYPLTVAAVRWRLPWNSATASTPFGAVTAHIVACVGRSRSLRRVQE